MTRYLGRSFYFNTAEKSNKMLIFTDFGHPYVSDTYVLASAIVPDGLEAIVFDQYTAFDYVNARKDFFEFVNSYMTTYNGSEPVAVTGVVDPDKNAKRIAIKALYKGEKEVYIACADNGLISRFIGHPSWEIIEAREIADMNFLPDEDIKKSEKSLWDGYNRFTPAAIYSALGRFGELKELNEIRYNDGDDKSLSLESKAHPAYIPKEKTARKIIVHFNGSENDFEKLESRIKKLTIESPTIIQTVYHGSYNDSFEAACQLRFSINNVPQDADCEHIYLSGNPEAYAKLDCRADIIVAGKNDTRFSLLPYQVQKAYKANESFLEDYLKGSIEGKETQLTTEDYSVKVKDDYSIEAKVERGVDCNGNRPLLAALSDIPIIDRWKSLGNLDEIMKQYHFRLTYIESGKDIFSFTAAYRTDYDEFTAKGIGIDGQDFAFGIVENPEIGTRRSRIELFEAYLHLGDRIKEMKGHELSNGYIRVEVVSNT